MKAPAPNADLWKVLETQVNSGVLASDSNEPAINLSEDPDFVFDSLRTQLAEDLYTAMKEAGLNENTLATKLGISRQAVNEVFQMKTNMTLKSLAKFCVALGVTPRLQLCSVKSAPGQPGKRASTGKTTNGTTPSRRNSKTPRSHQVA